MEPDAAAGVALVEALRGRGVAAQFTEDLETAVAGADILSCATLAETPVIRGEWLRPGQHLDLIGSFTPQMREADDAAIARSTVYIDTEAALAESGDLIAPIAARVLGKDDIAGTLYDLCAGRGGRRSAGEITLFKGVGVAVEDLAAAMVAWRAAPPPGA
ncbi:ornithine cyclodeaminase [Methylobrevis pamukkalensis]|uniref:Ornithine cyclodeaminase n=1 Tax=Methylobrevis pamukkalensis TaxID=1439726 RepID=A0A1E3H6B3_9HYPH|nr:ornithine cyclodeaminase [Methylobrevis pamukkalensis]